MDVDAVAIGSFFAGPTFTAPPAAAVKAAQRSASHLSASPAWPAADTAARATSVAPWIRATRVNPLGSTSRASLLAASTRRSALRVPPELDKLVCTGASGVERCRAFPECTPKPDAYSRWPLFLPTARLQDGASVC